MKLIDVTEAMNTWYDSWLEWQLAKKWSKELHPAWVRLATQIKRPEIRETHLFRLAHCTLD